MTDAPRTPGELEMAILDVLWRQGAGTAHDVRDELAARRPLAYSTVLTVMRRMEEKGMLTRRKESRRHVYEPAVDRASIRTSSLRDLLKRCFGGSPGELVMHLVEEDELSAKELQKIEALVAAKKKARAKKGGGSS